jgi:hypothetical protein
VRRIASSYSGNAPERILAVLDNPQMIAVARAIADALGSPLSTLVWDPPEYFLTQLGFGRWAKTRLLDEFQACLSASASVAVVSETMQSDYAAFTRAQIHVLRHGIDFPGVDSREPGDGEFVLGFAGSMYSPCAWNALLDALDEADWRLGGRLVRIRVMTGSLELKRRHPARIEYLGFCSPEQVQEMLAGCDLCYMPQPFVESLAALCRYSFPTKLGNYLATGRPVFVHAPSDSALQQYFRQHRFGTSCDGLTAPQILKALERMLDPVEYREASVRALSLSRTAFSTRSFRASLERFLGIPVAEASPRAALAVVP